MTFVVKWLCDQCETEISRDIVDSNDMWNFNLDNENKFCEIEDFNGLFCTSCKQKREEMGP